MILYKWLKKMKDKLSSSSLEVSKISSYFQEKNITRKLKSHSCHKHIPPTMNTLAKQIQQHINKWHIITKGSLSQECMIALTFKVNQGAGYRMLGAGALGWPRGMAWGGRWEWGSGLGTHVHPWRIHVDVWQNQYNIVK